MLAEAGRRRAGGCASASRDCCTSSRVQPVRMTLSGCRRTRSCHRRRAGRIVGGGGLGGPRRARRALRSGTAGRRALPLLSRRPARHGDRQRQSPRAVGQRGGRSLPARDRRGRRVDAGPTRPEFHFFDFQLGQRWTLRPNDGAVPWWILDAEPPRAGHAPRRLSRAAHPAAAPSRPAHRRSHSPCDGVLWDKFLRPVLLSALNTAPEEASADLAGAIVRETFAKGGRHMRPLVATPSLAAAFVDPALASAAASAARTSASAVRCAPCGSPRTGCAALTFDDGEETLGAARIA